MEELTKLDYYLLFLYAYKDGVHSRQERLPQSLLDGGLIEELVDEPDFSYKLTEKGTEYIEGLSPAYLVDSLLSMFAWRTRIKRLIQEFISVLSLEQLTELLVYKDPDIRRLAGYRYEELSGRVE